MRIRERIRDALREAVVDTERGIIRDVVLLGLRSANAREYDEAGVRRAVEEGLYSGVHVYADHVPDDADGSAPRSVRELIGTTGNARFERGKVLADLNITTSDPTGRKVLEIASRPELNGAVGMSHDALGEMDEGEKRVVEITEVLSVDVVTRPATTKSLFESEGRMKKRARENVGRKITVRGASGDVSGMIVRGPVYEVEVEGEEFPRTVPAELIVMDPEEPEEPDAAEPPEEPAAEADDEEPEMDDKREGTRPDPEVAELRRELGILRTREACRTAAEPLPPKLRERVLKRFDGQVATDEEVTAYVTDMQEAIADSKAAEPETDAELPSIWRGPRGRVVESESDDDEISGLISSAFPGFARVEG